MADKVYNFYPGPATLPSPALEKAKEELLDYQGTGVSVMEISHRSKQYDKIHHDAMDLARELMDLDDEFKILWLQGGASTQFYMVPQNLARKGEKMQYVDTGRWSVKAIKEAKLYGDVEVVASSEEDNFKYVPQDVVFDKGISYAHITTNNTIYGTEYHYLPKAPEDVPLVADMSSNIMDKQMDYNKFSVIYAGAQKNMGPAGTTLVAVRENLLDRVPEDTPTMLKWATHAKKDSMFNTPPAWAVYICKLSLEYLKEIGGVAEVERRNRRKAKMLYDVIDGSDGFYRGHARKDSRSLMNVTFNLPTEELEKRCVDEGLKRGLLGLKGHRSVGGMRASIYNAMPVEGVEKLVGFLEEFRDENQ